MNQLRPNELMDKCEKSALQFLQPMLVNLFENADSALIEFAGKAQSNAAQQQFFDAMAELKRRRASLKKAFLDEVSAGFDRFRSGANPDSSATGWNSDSLSLVGKDDTSEQVALQNMINKVQFELGSALFALRQRLAVLNQGRKLSDAEVPGGPTALAAAFHTAAAQLSLEHTTRIMVYLLFERFVLRKTGPLYDEYNRHLVEAGILPHLKYEIKRRSDQKRGTQGTPTQAEQPAADQAGDTPTAGAAPAAGTPGGAPGTPGGAPGTPGGAPGTPAAAAAHGAVAHAAGSGVGAANTVANGGVGGGAGPAATAPASAVGTQQPPQQAAGHESAGDPTVSQTVGEELFESILGLMRGRAPQKQSAGRQGTPIQRPALVSAIDRVQQTPQVAADGGDAPEFATMARESLPSVEGLNQGIQEERKQLYKGVDRKRLSQTDTDIIDLVGMIFEYMLNDPDIPHRAKAILSRLHTPFLKVAILDKDFFIDKRHPAHRLLNEATHAAVHWGGEQDTASSFYKNLESAVNRVRSEFRSDVVIFEETLSMFRALITEMEQSAKRVEERARQAAIGQERLHAARRRAAATVDQHIGGRKLDADMHKLLEQTWADTLTFILLRDPQADEGENWQAALSVCENIIASLAPPLSEDQRSQRRGRQSATNERIGEQLISLGRFCSEKTESIVERVRAAQDKVLSAPCAAPETEPADTAAPAPSVAQKPKTTHTVEHDPQLDTIHFGDWFEVEDESRPEQTRRLKLAWFSRISGQYMFVDNTGVKVDTLSAIELGKRLRQGTFKPVREQNAPFLLRALQRVRSLLGSGAQARA